MPKQLQELINLTTAICPQCPGTVLSFTHARLQHGIDLPEFEDIMKDLESKQIRYQKLVFINSMAYYIVKIRRRETLEITGKYLEKFITRVRAHLNKKS